MANPNQTSATAQRAQDFTDSLGVNVHLNYGGSGYGNTGEVLKALEYINIKEVRSIPPFDWSMYQYEPLLQKGIKFDFLYPDYSVNDLSATLGMIARVETLYPGSVSAIEGLNEANTWPGNYNGSTNIQSQVSFQQALFSTIQSNPTLKDVPVYNLTLGGASPDFTRSLGDMSAISDFGNAHVYFGGASPPQNTLDYIDPWIWSNTPGKPRIITETGYITIPQDSNHVDETTQAKYTLDLLLDSWADGIEKTYLYELLDQNPNPSGSNVEDHYGLFRADYSPKPAATAIHNLSEILADDGATAGTFAVTGLPYRVSGLPASGNTLQFAKSDGSHAIAVWAEPRIWDATQHRAIAAPQLSVQVEFQHVYDTVLVYDPLMQAAPLRTLYNVDRVTLGLTDHPLVVEVRPNAAVPVQPPAAGVATTIGAGSDTLTLKVQQDAYQGSAQYTVRVDGVQIGGTLTASATRASGQSDTLTVHGNFAPGAHRAEVNFLNDLYAGTPATDRNLFVNAGTYNGDVITFTAKQLMSSGLAFINFQEAQPPAAGVATTIGSGPDTLTLKLQQDAYQGSAQYMVRVDGVQIGGTLTASATRASGQSDTLTVLGNFAPGTHRTEVNFLNDLYAGTPATDRNLFVNAGTYNGAALSGVESALLRAGSSSFGFIDRVG